MFFDDMIICRINLFGLFFLIGFFSLGCMDFRGIYKFEECVNYCVFVVFLGNGSGVFISVLRDFLI